MKKFVVAAVAAIALSSLPSGEAKAQYPAWNGGYFYNPTPSFGYAQNRSYYNPATGYGGYNNSGFSVGPVGYGYYNYSGNYARPIYSGPFHSIYNTPTGGGIIYGTGYRNTPVYSQNYYFGW